MHPILANRTRLTLYLASWMAVGVLLAGVRATTGGLEGPPALIEALPLALLYAFVGLSAWWVCRAAPLGRAPAPRVLGMMFGAAAIAALVWGAIAVAWIHVIETALAGIWPSFVPPAVPHADPQAARAMGFGTYVTAGVPLYLFSAAVHYLIIAFESSRAAERVALEAQVVARDAELRALRAQLNPHFLFNSLNSINALIGSDPEGARRMCERLGDFLRRTLALAARASVPLGEEIQLIEQYLGIERVRFGERLSGRVAVSDDAARCMVPPLVLQPLVRHVAGAGDQSVRGGRAGASRCGGRPRQRAPSPACGGAAPRAPDRHSPRGRVPRRDVPAGSRG
jgi:two-component system sensor histidine kinase AlgZ